MSTLVKARRKVWLVQSPLTEACRRALRSVPVEPGELFGPGASQVLDQTIQAREKRRQFAGLHRRHPILGLDVQQLPLRSAFCRRLLATKGFSDQYSVLLRGWPGTFEPLIVFPLDNPVAPESNRHPPNGASRGWGTRNCGHGAGCRLLYPTPAQLLGCLPSWPRVPSSQRIPSKHEGFY